LGLLYSATLEVSPREKYSQQVEKGKHKANRDNPMKNTQTANSLRPTIPSFSSDESFELYEYMSQCHSVADIVAILASGQQLKSYLSCVSFKPGKTCQNPVF